MKSSDVFPSKWLSAADLAGREPNVTIDRVVMEEIGQGESKPVVYFVGQKKGLIINKTNWERVAYILKTDESDEWPGKPVKLYTELVNFQGQMKEAIRIKAADRGTAQPPKPVHVPHHVQDKTGPTPPVEAYEDIQF